MTDPTDIEIRFEDESDDDVLDALAETGAQRVTTKEGLGMTGVEVVMGFVAAHLLADLVVKLVRLWSCGIIVNAAGPRLKVQRNCSLPRGSVLVVNREGTNVTFKDPSTSQLDFLTSLFKSNQPKE